MDRVAQLAAELASAARIYRSREITAAGLWTRKDTREYLADIARELGFPENEISAAIDTALAGR